jgi:ubiquinone/menaquinone biosynthesis C-methylase UbiE
MTYRVAEAVRKACAFDEKTTVMEFACGTGAFMIDAQYYKRDPISSRFYLGLVSKQLAPFCKHIVGVDISQGMVDQYNKRTENQNMKAMCAELKGEPGELDDEKFDVIVVRRNVFCATHLFICRLAVFFSIPSFHVHR